MTTSPIYEPREATAEPVTSAFVAKLAGSRLPCLDGLRAIAAYLVVLAHIGILQRIAPDNWGPFAVNIFFVISGFLITFLLIREFEKNSKVSIRKFYLRRTLRIFPAFYVCWGFTLVLGIALHRKFGPWEPVATFFYMGDYYRAFHDSPKLLMGIAWSLGIEEKFYLLWPMLFVALAGRWAKLFKMLPRRRGTGLAQQTGPHACGPPSLPLLRVRVRHARRCHSRGLRVGPGHTPAESAGVVCRRGEPTRVDAANDRASDRNRRGCFARGPRSSSRPTSPT